MVEREKDNLEPTRKDRQLQILHRWFHNKGIGTAQCVTGFGKTTLALLMLQKYRKGTGQKNTKVIITVPTTYLVDQWKYKLNNWELSSNIEVWTIQSLIKRNHECSVLIADEIHMYSGKHFSKLFECVSYNQILGLTATLDEKDEKLNIIREKCPVIDTVSLREASSNNWISDFTVYNLGFELTEEQREKYNTINSQISKNFAYFDHDFKLMIKVITDKNARQRYSNQLRLTSGQAFGLAKKAKDAIQDRQNFLYNLPQKVELASSLASRLKGEYIICFSQSIEIADNIAKQIPDICWPYHSKIKVNTLFEALGLFPEVKKRSFNNKESKVITIKRFLDPQDNIRVLSTAKSLDMGVDIPHLDTGIITSGTSRALQTIQRMGRVLRLQEGSKAKIVDIYAKNTQDYNWLLKRQTKIPRHNIKSITSIEEIPRNN